MSRSFLRLRFLAAALLIFVFSLFAVSCASAKKGFDNDFFYEDNISFFKDAELSNGIHVVIKNIPFEKNAELRAVFLGGASASAKGKGGIDLLTFELLSEGKDQIKERLARGLYYPVYDCFLDYSYYGFSCSAEDFFESLPIFASSIFQPEYSHDDYIKKESAAASGAISRSENPRHDLLRAVQKQIYQGSPYAEGIFYKPESRISEYDIEKNLSSLLNASRIVILAAGNFSYKEKLEKGAKREKKSDMELFDARSQKILEELEILFGGAQKSAWRQPDLPPLKLSENKALSERSEFAGSDYYASLCFSCPNRGDDDYEAFALCSLAADSLFMRELVEGQKKSSYCGTAVLNSRQSAALIVASGKKGVGDFQEALKAALKKFPSQNDLERTLDFYKNIYISRVAASSRNAGASLDQMTSGLFYQGDAKAFLNRPKKIRAVTSQDVAGAFEKYFHSDNSLFVLLTN